MENYVKGNFAPLPSVKLRSRFERQAVKNLQGPEVFGHQKSCSLPEKILFSGRINLAMGEMIMNFELNEKQAAMEQMAENFAEKEVVPNLKNF